MHPESEEVRRVGPTADASGSPYRQVTLGESVPSVRDAWRLADGTTGAEAIAEYCVEVERGSDVIRCTPVGRRPGVWPAWWPAWRYDNLRRVILD